MKVVTAKQMLELEHSSSQAGSPPEILMENAGLAVAQKARDFLDGVVGRQILVLVGPGNNGGDGLVAARHLHDWGARVHLYLTLKKTRLDKNCLLNLKRGVECTDISGDDFLSTFQKNLLSSDLLVDALLGTGKVRPFDGLLKHMLELISSTKGKNNSPKILSIDMPSGMDADTGTIDPAGLTADLTVTLGYPKIGLFLFPGAAKLGRLEIVDIGIPSDLAENIQTELLETKAVKSLLPTRPLNASKGTFGRLMVVAGSINFVGAACLACEGAMRTGTGLVSLAIPKSLHPIFAAKLTESTFLPLPENNPGFTSFEAVKIIQKQLASYDTLLVGCGLGVNKSSTRLVEQLLCPDLSVSSIVIDADGLNILGKLENWWQKLKGNTVLTPHPGEMSRLTGHPVNQIQANRLQVAKEAAENWNQTVVLKGAHTVVAAPDGRTHICGVANPGLATAGTGDVLAGIIAGLAAQGLPLYDAACCGVFLHAMAGELVTAEIGNAGMIASDLLPAIPRAIKNLKSSI